MLLTVHAAAGTAALALGALVLAGRTGASGAYRLLVLVVAATALLMAGPSTLPVPVRVALVVVAVGTAVAVARGSERALRASYVSLVAAVAFVSAPVWAGALVVVVGSVAAHVTPLRATPAPA